MKFGERMVLVENNIQYIRKKLDKFVDSAENKFASKLTERIVYCLCGAILLSFLAYLTKLVGWWK